MMEESISREKLDNKFENNEINLDLFKIPKELNYIEVNQDLDIYESVLDKYDDIISEEEKINEVIDYINEKLDSEILDNDDLEDQILEMIEEETYYSTYEERINRTPINNGYWSGERGESIFYSYNESVNGILESFGLEGIRYENGIPDFSQVSKGIVKIEYMTENRDRNFTQAREKLADEKGYTPQEVEKWMKDNNYTWHEDNDRETMYKVPSEVNAVFKHLGGVSECKKSTEIDWEDEFDE